MDNNEEKDVMEAQSGNFQSGVIIHVTPVLIHDSGQAPISARQLPTFALHHSDMILKSWDEARDVAREILLAVGSPHGVGVTSIVLYLRSASGMAVRVLKFDRLVPED